MTKKSRYLNGICMFLVFKVSNSRIQLARALLTERKWLFLDEAFSALDQENTLMLEHLLLTQQDLTIISVCHKPLKDMMKLYDVIIEMKNGYIHNISKKEKME